MVLMYLFAKTAASVLKMLKSPLGKRIFAFVKHQ